MSWRNKYRPASFRGARFWVESHDANGGRRVAVHEYPGRDVPTTEDLGKLAEGFSLVAYVATTPTVNDYMPERDALMEALRKKGPGELVHPYLGTMRVQNFTWRMSEVRDQGGMAVFDLVFGEAGASTTPTVFRSVAAGMRSAAENAMASAAQNFADTFVIHGKPDYLRDEAAAELAKLRDLYTKIGRLAGIANEVAAIAYDLADAVNHPHYGTSPRSMADRIISLAGAVTSAFESPWKRYLNIDGTYRTIPSMRGGPLDEAVVASLLRTMEFSVDVPVVKYATATRRQQLANQSAIGELARQSALIEAARVAPFVNWRTLEDAESARERIADALDHEMEVTGDDTLFRQLTALRTMVMKTVPQESAQLPFLVERTPPQTIPAIALAYDMYDSLERADEILHLNKIPHPGFVPGMVKLKVLANV